MPDGLPQAFSSLVAESHANSDMTFGRLTKRLIKMQVGLAANWFFGIAPLTPGRRLGRSINYTASAIIGDDSVDMQTEYTYISGSGLKVETVGVQPQFAMRRGPARVE